MRSMGMAEDNIDAMVVSMCDSCDLAVAAGSTPCALAANTPSSQRQKNGARRLTDDEILAKRAEFLKEKAAREAYRRSRPFAAADPPIDLREAYRREQASQAPAVAAPAAAEDEDEDSDDAPLESLITVRRRDDSSDDD